MQEYLAHMISGAHLYDGVENITINSIIATPPRQNAKLPWFGKVVAIRESEVDVLWFQKLKGNKYFYLNDTCDPVSFNAIICNGIEFTPIFGDKLVWKLMTPLPFINAMQQEIIPTIEPPCTTPTIVRKKDRIDLSSLVFSTTEELEQYLLDNVDLQV